jgi:hypothetical protein
VEEEGGGSGVVLVHYLLRLPRESVGILFKFAVGRFVSMILVGRSRLAMQCQSP